MNLVRSGRTREALPERPIPNSDRHARRGVAGSGSGATTTAFRVGNAALRKGSTPLQTHEQALATAMSGAFLLSSLLTLRFPRLLAWPLALLGSIFGGLGLIRALRAGLSRNRE